MFLLLCGKRGSGKSTTAEFMSDIYGYKIISASDIINGYIISQNEEITVESRIFYSEKLINESVSGSIFEYAEFNPEDNYVIDAVVHWHDFNYLTSLGQEYFVLGLTVDEDERFNRIVGRNKQGDPANQQELNEIENNYMPDVNQILKKANCVISNTSNSEALKHKIIEVIPNQIEDEAEDLLWSKNFQLSTN